jgi:hypothetical protein
VNIVVYEINDRFSSSSLKEEFDYVNHRWKKENLHVTSFENLQSQ